MSKGKGSRSVCAPCIEEKCPYSRMYEVAEIHSWLLCKPSEVAAWMAAADA